MEKQKFAQKNTNSFKKLHTIRTNNLPQKQAVTTVKPVNTELERFRKLIGAGFVTIKN